MPAEQARPDARSHVSAEQVADLLEDLLAADEAATVATHLSTCNSCAAVRDRLEGLPALLASARTDDPMLPMPADVAGRLDRALAAEARERAAGSSEPVDEQATATVVPISRATRSRKVFAGLVAAAAVVTGFVVVGDVVGGGSDGTADMSSADSGADDGADAGAESDQSDGYARSSGEAASPGTTAALAPVSAQSFGDDVAALLQDPDALAGNRSNQSMTTDGAVAAACTPAQLRGAEVTGADGPVVLLDDQPVTLVTSGPRADRLVVAYSCEGGPPAEQARAVVDLTQ